MLKRKGGINLLKTLAIESEEHREGSLYTLCDLNEWMKDMKDEFFCYNTCIKDSIDQFFNPKKDDELWYDRRIEDKENEHKDPIKHRNTNNK